MVLKVFNTLTKKKEIFKPRKKGKIDMFVCGPTVYNYIHIGNAKTFAQFDIIVNYLRSKKYEVKYIQNITDIDDKIIIKAKEMRRSAKEVAEEFYTAFKEDMGRIEATSVSKYVKATDHIKEIISQVQRLIENGIGYKTSDGIYFDLKKDPEYGKLSGRTVEGAEDATSRIDAGTEKRNKGDFCLWKFEKPGEPSWDAPFGKGRPGWHIEDTAITEHFFGQQYDIHGGASDLIFPHHEAEIAQMESLSGKKPFVKYWLHAGFLDMDQEKMSKSKGNFITLRDLLKKHDPRVIRFFYASSHYRARLNFSEELLKQAKQGLERINDCIANLNKKDNEALIAKTKKWFYRAMDDDFNTPVAFSTLFDCISKLNKEGSGGKKTKEFFKEVNTIFKICTFETVIPKKIKELAEERLKARQQKDWKRSDLLRKEIERQGYLIEDTTTRYRIKK